jgi:hypothetical protein
MYFSISLVSSAGGRGQINPSLVGIQSDRMVGEVTGHVLVIVSENQLERGPVPAIFVSNGEGRRICSKVQQDQRAPVAIRSGVRKHLFLLLSREADEIAVDLEGKPSCI